jgi:hypothetical protein
MDKELATSILLIHQRLNKLETNLVQKGNKPRIYFGKSYATRSNFLQFRRIPDDLDEGFLLDVDQLIEQLDGYTKESRQNWKDFVDDEFGNFQWQYRALTISERRHLKESLQDAYPHQRDTFTEMLMEVFEMCYPESATVDKQAK